MEPAVQLTEIRRLVEAVPFRPFRICTSDGAEHVVRNPKFVFLTRHQIWLGLPEDAEDFPESTILLSTLHLTRIEVLGESS